MDSRAEGVAMVGARSPFDLLSPTKAGYWSFAGRAVLDVTGTGLPMDAVEILRLLRDWCFGGVWLALLMLLMLSFFGSKKWANREVAVALGHGDTEAARSIVKGSLSTSVLLLSLPLWSRMRLGGGLTGSGRLD